MGWKGGGNNIWNNIILFTFQPVSSSLLPYKRYLYPIAMATGWLSVGWVHL